MAQKLVLQGHDCFFVRYRPFQERALAGPIPHKKSATFWVALLLVRDSVGIRTQDPQLRRLLLYPAELPNQSLFRFESGCKDREYFETAKIYFKKVVFFFGGGLSGQGCLGFFKLVWACLSLFALL